MKTIFTLIIFIAVISCTKESSMNLPYPIFFPNAFTPNGDGINDTYAPVFQWDVRVDTYRMEIFSTAYQKIFHTTDTAEAWTGFNPNGTPQPAGTYFCRVSGTHRTGEEFEASISLTLLRP